MDSAPAPLWFNLGELEGHFHEVTARLRWEKWLSKIWAFVGIKHHIAPLAARIAFAITPGCHYRACDTVYHYRTIARIPTECAWGACTVRMECVKSAYRVRILDRGGSSVFRVRIAWVQNAHGVRKECV